MPKNWKPARAAEPLPRAWQRMLSGRRLDLLDPSPVDIEIEDIAHGLARVAAETADLKIEIAGIQRVSQCR